MLKRIVIAGAALLIVALFLLPQESDDVEGVPGEGVGDVRGFDSVDRPDINLDPAKVPRDLRDLIPFAEEWGIGDDVIRAHVEEAASDLDKERFSQALGGRTARVTEWLDSFGMELMSDEAATYMYMLSALDEMGIWPDQ
jgi:hypothetical protein